MSRSSIIAIIAFIVVTGLLFTLSQSTTRNVQAKMLEVVRPLHATTSSVGRNIGALGKGLKSLEELEQENSLLTRDNQSLRAYNQLLSGLKAENDQLRQSLGFRENAATKYRLLPARIIARSAATWWSNVQIDRGELDGVEDDMPVITDVGLVGKTTTVAKSTAYVVLIADENCKVAVNVEGTREQGILSGERVANSVQPDLVLNFLSKNAALKIGQRVVSSGVSGGVFPSDLLVGTIKDFQPRVLDGRATVTPAVDLSKLENVFVVLGTKPKEKPKK
jgi:rod shape-determining protein MreC